LLQPKNVILAAQKRPNKCKQYNRHQASNPYLNQVVCPKIA